MITTEDVRRNIATIDATSIAFLFMILQCNVQYKTKDDSKGWMIRILLFTHKPKAIESKMDNAILGKSVRRKSRHST